MVFPGRPWARRDSPFRVARAAFVRNRRRDLLSSDPSHSRGGRWPRELDKFHGADFWALARNGSFARRTSVGAAPLVSDARLGFCSRHGCRGCRWFNRYVGGCPVWPAQNVKATDSTNRTCFGSWTQPTQSSSLARSKTTSSTHGEKGSRFRKSGCCDWNPESAGACGSSAL